MFSSLTTLLMAGGAALLAIILAFMKGRLDGAKLERANQATREAKARSEADAIDDAVAGRTPQENRERLKKWSKS